MAPVCGVQKLMPPGYTNGRVGIAVGQVGFGVSTHQGVDLFHRVADVSNGSCNGRQKKEKQQRNNSGSFHGRMISMNKVD